MKNTPVANKGILKGKGNQFDDDDDDDEDDDDDDDEVRILSNSMFRTLIRVF